MIDKPPTHPTTHLTTTPQHPHTQSFPPTPISRACVMARFSQFSDDVVYLARDQLRLEELVKAEDDVTKMAAQSLKQQACLAVFNSEDTANGVVLSCGGHCATKVGTTSLYTSTRAMVPIMRNRHVFFQASRTREGLFGDGGRGRGRGGCEHYSQTINHQLQTDEHH